MLTFLKLEALHPLDFTIREDGVVRLNPELARTVSGLAARGALWLDEGDPGPDRRFHGRSTGFVANIPNA